MKFKCDLCDKKIEMDEGKFMYDKFREKNVIYCHECAGEYEDASASWKDRDDFINSMSPGLRKRAQKIS